MFIQRRLHVKASRARGFTDRILDAVEGVDLIEDVDGVQEAISGWIKVQGPVGDTEIILGPGLSSGRILYLRADKEIQVKLDDTGNTPVVVKPLGSGIDGVFYLDGNFNKVFFKYSGSEELGLFYAIIGS